MSDDQKLTYCKPALSLDGQIDLLISRGLEIPDRDKARHYRRYIGYYRLSGYCLTKCLQDTRSPISELWDFRRTGDRIPSDGCFDLPMFEIEEHLCRKLTSDKVLAGRQTRGIIRYENDRQCRSIVDDIMLISHINAFI